MIFEEFPGGYLYQALPWIYKGSENDFIFNLQKPQIEHFFLSLVQGYGLTGTGEQCLSTSYFRIASISKTLTAMATMQLVEQNKLKLKDKIFSRKGKGN